MNDIEFAKKMTVLCILKNKGEEETIRLYPEYIDFIQEVKKDYKEGLAAAMERRLVLKTKSR